MKIYYLNINKIFNSYNSGKKFCICNYNKYSILIFGYFIKNKIIKNYYIFYLKKKIFIIILINNIHYLKYYSKPSKSIYVNFKNIKKFINLGLTLINTNIGLLSLKKCLKLEIGGKLFFSIL